MALPPFTEDYSSPADQAWRAGESPYAGTLGPNRTADTVKNSFVAKLKKNPDYAEFYSNRTFGEVSPTAQSKIDLAAKSDQPTFADPGDNSFAQNFLTSYKEGVMRGLIEEDRAVSPSNLARLTTEFATQGSNQKDPNTVNQFPGQEGVKI